MSQSEVRRLLEQINAEYQAAQWGLSGLAQGTAQHDFITARLENMENRRQELENLVGQEESTRLVVERMIKQEDKGQGRKKPRGRKQLRKKPRGRKQGR
jgi:hypothetical protein